jgi:hypothetical protein
MNFQITARWNESKADMPVDTTDTGTPLPSVVGTRLAIGAREPTGSINQVAFVNGIKRGLHFISHNIADFPANTFGYLVHGDLVGGSGDVTVTPMTTYIPYDFASDNQWFVRIPSEAGWVKEGNSVEGVNMGQRLTEKTLEVVLRKV